MESLKIGRKLIILFNIVLILVIMLFAEKLTGIFNTDPQVIAMASKYIRISCWMYIIYAVYYPLMGFIKGTGNAMFAFKNTVVARMGIRVPVAYFMAKIVGLGFYGVVAAWIIAPIWSNTVYTIYLRSGKWYEKFEKENEMPVRQMKKSVLTKIKVKYIIFLFGKQ